MNRLYIFAIGGSGERVLKSLIMTLAAGTPIQANEVIPVIVDNDAESAALKDCQRLLTAYGTTEGDNGVRTLYEKTFGNDASQWPSFCHTVIKEPVLLNVAGNTIGNLEGIIGCPAETNNPRDKEDNALIHSITIERDLLFTKEDKEMPLTVGFVGNPNIGSVVLNSLSFTDPAFSTIVTGIQSNDGVIVIGSLFGGTGAAGFPLIVNTFNKISDPTRKPVLGGVAVLPYFDTDKKNTVETGVIARDRWDVDSDTFGTKTRAALMYYDDYMLGVDCMYYVGDDKHRVYSHCVGGVSQKNEVNLTELLSAMSIIDFAKQDHSRNTIYKRPIWGFVANDDATTSNVSGITNAEMKKALVKFQLLEEIMKNPEFLAKAISTLESKFVSEIHFTEEMRTSTFTTDRIKYIQATGLNHLFMEWDEWIGDLSSTDAVRKFLLFDHAKKTDGDNITSNFFADSQYGISRTTQKTVGPLWDRKVVTEAVQPIVLDTMLEVYNKLPDAMKKNVSDPKKLSLELLIISLALDNILKEKCSL